MVTKIINNGTGYNSGYALDLGKYSAISVTALGAIRGTYAFGVQGGDALTLAGAASAFNSGLIRGGDGGYGSGIAGGTGVTLAAGGYVLNSASISGGYGSQGPSNALGPEYGGVGGAGVAASGAVTVVNDGALNGGRGGVGGGGITGGPGGTGGSGIALAAGGSVYIGAAGHLSGGAGGAGGSAYLFGGNGGTGGVALLASGEATLVNHGSISGGAAGVGGVFFAFAGGRDGLPGAPGGAVRLNSGGAVTNGSSANATATIYGAYGVYAGAGGAVTITNYAIIHGLTDAVLFKSAADRLIIESNASFAGAIVGGGGSLEIASGSDTLTGLGSTASLGGGAVASFSGFGAYQIDAGARLTLARTGTLGASQTLVDYGLAELAGTLVANGVIVGGAGAAQAVGGSFGGVGATALSVTAAGALLTNGGAIIGGAGGAGEPAAASQSGPGGGAGGTGLLLEASAATSTGTIRGGAGGAGGEGGYDGGGLYPDGKGGAGGVGVQIAAGATLGAKGLVAGGAGGAGGVSSSGTVGAEGGYGGAGGTGALVYGALTIVSGMVEGGAGGGGGAANPAGVILAAPPGGAGGAGARVNGGFLVNRGTLEGGAGGAGGAITLSIGGGVGGAGGAGLVVGGAVTIVSTGAILGGGGGLGGSGTPPGAAGAGGDGVDIAAAAAAVLTNGTTKAGSALIEGRDGVYAAAGATATVTNFGTIAGTTDSVVFKAAADRLIAEAGSTLTGYAFGGGGALELAGGAVNVGGLGGKALATGSVNASFGGFGTYQVDAGVTLILTGASALVAARTLANAGTVSVAGTLSDAGAIANSGLLSLANGSSLQAQGLIGDSGSITLTASTLNTDLRVLAAGVTLGGGGTLSLGGAKSRILGASSAATLTNVDNTLVGEGVIGANSLTLVNESKGVIDAVGGFGLTVATKGETLVNQGLMEATGGGTLAIVNTTVANAGGTIMATNVSPVKLQNAVVQGGGITATGTGVIKFNVSGGELDGKAGTVSLSGVAFVVNGSNETIEGSIANAGKINLIASTSTSDLIIGAAGATLSGGGQVNMTNSLSNRIYGLASGDTLTNVDNRIDGAGVLGNGVMTLVNDAKGQIVGNQNLALTIDTGTNTIVNAGLIENVGKGGTLVKSAVANTGTIEAATAGTLTLQGVVTGSGVAIINGGTLSVQQAFAERVTFTGSTGTLELGDSQAFTGKVVGLSTSGTNALDLVDIGFFAAKTKATYSGTTASGTLTVTDGTHTANIALMGNYLASTWTLSGDGHGGTKVVDPSIGAAPLAQAMASFRPGLVPGHAAWTPPTAPRLLLTHVQT